MKKIKRKTLEWTLTGAIAIGTIFGGTILYKTTAERSEKKIKAKYSSLIGKPYQEQKTYILEDLSKESLSYRLPHPIGFSNGIKEYTARRIVKNLEK